MALDRHTRIVGWLKVLLPMVALVMLSTLFLVSRSIDPSAAIPFADVDIEERARTPRMTLPTYAAATEDGGTITISAAEARPGADDGSGSASQVTAELLTPDGGRTDLTAAEAELPAGTNRLQLGGGVTIRTATGWNLRTQSLELGLDRSGARSADPVEADGPPGRVEAGQMEIMADPARAGAYVLVFKDGVRLLYQP